MYSHKMVAVAIILASGVAVSAVKAQQGGSLPLTDVMQVVKPYPNLAVQIRVALAQAGIKQSAVICSGERFPNSWKHLGGARHAPYECRIGNKTLHLTAVPTYYDARGYKLDAKAKDLAEKAKRIEEKRVKWGWK